MQKKINTLQQLLSEEAGMNSKIAFIKNKMDGIFDLKNNDNDLFNLDDLNNFQSG